MYQQREIVNRISVVEDIYFRGVQVKENKKAYVSIFNTHAFVNRISNYSPNLRLKLHCYTNL